MSVKEFTIGFSRTVNLGGYESARVEASVIYQVGPEDSLEVSAAAAQRELKALLDRTWWEQKETIKGRKEIA